MKAIDMKAGTKSGLDDCYMKPAKGIAAIDEDIARAGADSAQAAIDGGAK